MSKQPEQLKSPGESASPSAPPQDPTTPPESVLSSQIFRGAKEIRILHGDDTYRLRITRNGKLILTK